MDEIKMGEMVTADEDMTLKDEAKRERLEQDEDVDNGAGEPSAKKMKGDQGACLHTSEPQKSDYSKLAPKPENSSEEITNFTSDESSLVHSTVKFQSSSDFTDNSCPEPAQQRIPTSLLAGTVSQTTANISTGFPSVPHSEISDCAIGTCGTLKTSPVLKERPSLDASVHLEEDRLKSCSSSSAVAESAGNKEALPLSSSTDSSCSKISSKSASSYEVSDKTLLDVKLTSSTGAQTAGAVDHKLVSKVCQDQAEIPVATQLGCTPSCLDPSFDFSRYGTDFSRVPTQMTGAWTEYSQSKGNFLKGCKWSPDGTCILTNSDDKTLRFFHQSPVSLCSRQDNSDEMTSAMQITEGELIYDYCWFPLMTAADPETCCMISSCRDTPVHMWDITTGKIKCSYRSYDHMDEVVAAHSLTFSPDGKKLYCGFNKMIRVFDTTRPGRQFQKRQTFAKQGQSGIISCIAVNPQQPSMYAAGSYSRAVAIYSEPKGSMECMFEGQVGGVTLVMFSPDGNKLYSGGRKDPEILCWDVRNPGKLLFTMQRKVITNQRMYFDIDSSSRYLLSGNHDGSVSIWDTNSPPIEDSEGESLLHPANSFQAHGDTCNGISLHPKLPVLATASGQRKFTLQDANDSSSEEDEEHEMTDNSLRLWWMGQA